MGLNTTLPDDAQSLRRCVRELTALSTLSAVWTDSDLRQIADGLCGVVLRSLPVTFVQVRLHGIDGSLAVEAAVTPLGPVPPNQSHAISQVVDAGLRNAVTGDTTVPNPFGSGTLKLVILPLGCGGDCGLLVAGFQDPDSPTPTDRLMLGVAANQAAIVLQHKRSTQQVRRSEAELSDFFDNATVGLHWVGPDGTILRANRAELSLLGYSADEYIGRHIAEFHVDRRVIDDILRRLSTGEGVRNYEARLRRKDGSVIHVLIDSSVLWDKDRFIHTRCFTRDITDLKQAAETRLRLAAIVESSQDAITSADLSGTITSWNRGAEALYGYAPDEIIGQPISVLIPSDHRDDFPTLMERLRQAERIDHYETVRICKGGGRVDVSLTVSAIRDPAGTLLGMSKIARDITQRKREQETLTRQTERLGLLWEAASVLLSASGPDSMLHDLFAKVGPHLGADVYLNYMVNDGGETLRVSSSEGVSAEVARQIARLDFEQASRSAVALQRRPLVATDIQHSDGPRLLKSLGIRAYVCNPLLIGDRLLGVLSFGSRTKDHFDDDEVAFIDTICHYFTVACERLRLVDELRESDRRKDEFLATLAHELRNPLAPIRSAVNVLHLKGADNPEARWGRDVIERQVAHLTRLIDDLLEVSRISRNELQLRKQCVELSEVINGAIEASRPLIEASGHELTVTLPAEPVYLEGDLVRLAQVFLNLLNNAAKYTERGGRIWLMAERDGDTLIARVKDTGLGIPPENLPRLFEMFYQVDRTLERSQGGLGIGLSLVRRLVEFHGGSVEVRSEGLGKGSEFIVKLPILVREPEALAVQPNNAVRNMSTTRILVVDDNRDSAESLSMFLRLNGHEVSTAYDGIEAVEAAERFRPDAVLLDIGLPRLSGEDACRRIRAWPWGRDMMLVALTGWGQDADRRRTLEAGFDAHLVKPVDPAEVMKLLASRRSAEASPLSRG
jgi:PAS domain S-box-containing protein